MVRSIKILIFYRCGKETRVDMDILSAASSNENMVDFILLKINEFLSANQLSKEIKFLF